MSMIGGLVTLGDENIERVLGDPPLVWRVLAPDDPEPYERERAAGRQRSWLDRLVRRAPPPPPPNLVLADAEGISTDLDKAWHGIHYLFTGTAWEGDPPLHFLVRGGREVGAIDVGYGPARAFTAAETRAIHEALGQLHDEALRARFDAADMAAKDIYPSIWDRDPAKDDTLGYLMEYLGILRGILAQTTDASSGMLVYIC